MTLLMSYKLIVRIELLRGPRPRLLVPAAGRNERVGSLRLATHFVQPAEMHVEPPWEYSAAPGFKGVTP